MFHGSNYSDEPLSYFIVSKNIVSSTEEKYQRSLEYNFHEIQVH